jgi:glycosyltransferase involved in cell wall biosynthesis
LSSRIEFLLVDDGSPEPAILAPNSPINLTLVRVKENIPWNQPGARNLGLKLAEGDWVIASDIDHILPAEGLRQVLSLNKDRGTVYFFERTVEGGLAKNPHPNSFLISRQTFWEVGGYDEDFCGHYGYDDTFVRLRFERTHKILYLKGPALVEIEHGATAGLNRNRWHNRRLLRKKRRLLEKGKYRNGRTVRFEWEVIARWRMDTHGLPQSRRTK